MKQSSYNILKLLELVYTIEFNDVSRTEEKRYEMKDFIDYHSKKEKKLQFHQLHITNLLTLSNYYYDICSIERSSQYYNNYIRC